jgi:hypothetical protein
MKNLAQNWAMRIFKWKYQKYSTGSSGSSSGFKQDGYTRFRRNGANVSVFQKGLSESGSRVIGLLVTSIWINARESSDWAL